MNKTTYNFFLPEPGTKKPPHQNCNSQQKNQIKNIPQMENKNNQLKIDGKLNAIFSLRITLIFNTTK